MKNQLKTKEALIQELVSLRERILELERSESERKQVEENLHESEEKYRNILENIEDGYFEVDRAGDFTFFNPSICRILGYPKEEMLGMNYRAYMDAENAKKVFQAFNKVYVTGIPTKGFEWEVIRKDGTRTYIEVSISLIVRPGEKPTRFRGIARDITERKQAEEALRESEQKYRWVLDNMADVITVMDMNLRFTYVSPSIMRMRGYTAEEATAQTFEQVMTPESLQIIARVFEEEMKLEASGTADPGRSRILELEQYRKDGSIVWMENSLSFMRDEAQKPVSIISLSRDITERKRAEEKLRVSEELFRSYLENAPDGVYMSDLEGNFLYGNRKCEEIIGYRKEELIGKNFLELNILPENSLNKAAQLLQANMEGKSTGPDEIDLISKEGRLKPVEINTNVVQRMGQRIVLAFVRDITERKRVEEALRESESLSKSLIDYMHDAMIILDWDGSILFANRAAARIIEFERPEEFVGHNMIEYLHPDSFQKAAEDIEAVKADKMGFLSEYQLYSVTGSTFGWKASGERSFSVTLLRILSASGISPSASWWRKNFSIPSKVSGKRLAPPFRSWCPPLNQEIPIQPVTRTGRRILPVPLPRRWDFRKIQSKPSAWRVLSMTLGSYPSLRRYCPSRQN